MKNQIFIQSDVINNGKDTVLTVGYKDGDFVQIPTDIAFLRTATFIHISWSKLKKVLTKFNVTIDQIKFRLNLQFGHIGNVYIDIK